MRIPAIPIEAAQRKLMQDGLQTLEEGSLFKAERIFDDWEAISHGKGASLEQFLESNRDHMEFIERAADWMIPAQSSKLVTRLGVGSGLAAVGLALSGRPLLQSCMLGGALGGLGATLAHAWLPPFASASVNQWQELGALIACPLLEAGAVGLIAREMTNNSWVGIGVGVAGIVAQVAAFCAAHISHQRAYAAESAIERNSFDSRVPPPTETISRKSLLSSLQRLEQDALRQPSSRVAEEIRRDREYLQMQTGSTLMEIVQGARKKEDEETLEILHRRLRAIRSDLRIVHELQALMTRSSRGAELEIEISEGEITIGDHSLPIS